MPSGQEGQGNSKEISWNCLINDQRLDEDGTVIRDASMD